MAFSQRTIIGAWSLPGRGPLQGEVEFTPSSEMRNGTDTVSGPTVVTLANGAISVSLAATTDVGTSPPSVLYRVIERIPLLPQPPNYTYYIAVPAGAGSIDLRTATRLQSVPPPERATRDDVAAAVAASGSGGSGGAVASVNGRTGIVTGLAEDSAVVHATGAETIAGVKTFSSAPVVPSAAFPESAIVNLVSDLTGKTATSRQVIAGTGLTGGGDLTADRTFTVAYGATSGTAAQGNDSRIAGAAQTANNLSDLVSPSAARTNLAVPADSAVVHNTGAETVAGTKTFSASPVVPDASFAIAKTSGLQTALDAKIGSALYPDLPAATYFYPLAPNSTASSATLGNGTLRVAPWMVLKSISLARIGTDIATVGEAGSKVRLVIYADNGAGFPGALVVDAGQIAGDSATVQELTISQTLTPGLYWVGAAVQSAPTTQPTVRTLGGHTPAISIGLGGTIPTANGNVVGYAGAATGAAPGTFPTGNAGSSSSPRIILRTA